MAKPHLIPVSFLKRGQFSHFLASFFLAFACFMLAIPESRAVPYVGDLSFVSQAQINAFPNIYTSVTGRLLIAGSSTYNLMPLQNLTAVGKSLVITNTNILPNLNGLNSITSVGGHVEIKINAALTNINGLNSLSSVGGGIYIYLNDVLTDLDGLNSVTSMGGILYVSGNNALNSLSGLNSITSGVLSLEIISNPILTNLDGLSSITSVEENLRIYQNAALTDLNGLSGITSVGGDFRIFNNAALTNLNGLSRITSVGGDLLIFNNAALTNLNGLSGITSVGGRYFQIYNNAALTDCCAIYDLLNSGNIGGGIYIQDNQTGCDSQAEINTYCADTDQDGIPNDEDNCPTVANAGQANNDGDVEGDVCDADDDNDGIADANDNCPLIANAGQEDLDNDGIGDVCDPVTNVGGAVAALAETIQGLNLTEGVKTALVAKLEAAMVSYCDNGNTNTAINQLNAFINQVEAKRGNPLTNEEADDLIARANALITAMQNGAVDCGGSAKPGKNYPITGIAGQLDIELFPNPAGSEVNIQMSGLESNGVVTIYNQLGSAVWQQPVESRQVSLKIQLADNVFAPGVYVVSLRCENEVITRRLVVSK